MRIVLWLFTVIVAAPAVFSASIQPIPQSFLQESGVFYGSESGIANGAASLVDIGADEVPRALVGGGWWEFRGVRWEWNNALSQTRSDAFVFAGKNGEPITTSIAWTSVRQVLRLGDKVWLATSEDPYEVVGGVARSMGWPSRFRVNQIAVGGDGETLWVASAAGLFRREAGGWRKEEVLDGVGRAWAVSDVKGVVFDTKGQLWFGTRAGVGCRTAEGWRFYEGKDGLPWNDFTGLAAGPSGEVWFATHLGVVRFEGGEWHYRQGRRWLRGDNVTQVVVARNGDAWFATTSGVGSIVRRPMTLAAKAELYEKEIERYIQRTPFGYVAEAPLTTPGDKTTAKPGDSDNDGLWTAMYGAGECFAYAAQGDEASAKRAKRAFEALRFLQKVTQGGSPQPPKGYVARTIRPVEWPDPNVGRLDGDRKEAERDKLWKVYEPRWPKSADGKWYWKGDTSSDELDGHYFFYPLYYDLCARDEAEKERVREVVRDLTDHIIAHDFSLVDHDGKPTRWGVYGPRSVNRDPFWWPERGLNSLSALTYLAVAEHVTGDPKYGKHALELVEKHGYGQNLMFPKAQYGPGSGNQSDDEMAFMCYYSLLKYSKNEALKNQVRYSFYAYWAMEHPEMNPFFNFAYAAMNSDKSITNVWGDFSVNPWAGWFEDSASTLRGFSLDRRDWSHKNSHRLDLRMLTAQQSIDLYEPRGRVRGVRVNGKVIPVENRHFNHWNTDPWHLDYGGSGGELASGTVFLLPYYMGLHHGFVAKP